MKTAHIASVAEVDTYVCGNTGDDDLLAAGGLDSLAEVRVVPSINLALTLHEGRGRVHRENLSGDRSICALYTLGVVSSVEAGR